MNIIKGTKAEIIDGAKSSDKVLKNVRIIDPPTGTDRIGDICITDGIISDIVFRDDPAGADASSDSTGYLGSTGSPDSESSTGSAGSPDSESSTGSTGSPDPSCLVAAPGLVDVHVHFRDPGLTYKEDIETGALAARAGGFSHVVMMANTRPVIDSVETLKDVLERGKATSVHVHSCGAITKGLAGRELTDMEAMLGAGALGFTDDGIPLLDRDIARRAMEEAARLDCVLSFHEEDPSYIENNGINRGKASAHYGIGGSDRMAEISMIERDIELAIETGAKVHFQHISCRESVELIRKGKLRGARITCEATPHHFSLTEDACIEKGTLAKMNPPLRQEADRLAIIEGLRDGTIDMIATDHAPHSKEEKDRPITEAPSGIIGLQTALGLGLNFLVKPGHISLLRLIELMSTAPARLYGLDRAPYYAGSLRVGCPADILVFDPNMDYRIRSEEILSKSKNSPFLV